MPSNIGLNESIEMTGQGTREATLQWSWSAEMVRVDGESAGGGGVIFSCPVLMVII